MSIWDNLRKKRQRTTTITVPESVPMWADPEAGGLGIKTIEARTLVGHAKSDQLQFAVLADVAAATGEHAQAVSGIMRAGRRELEKRAKAEGIPIDEMGKRIQAEAGMDPRKGPGGEVLGPRGHRATARRGERGTAPDRRRQVRAERRAARPRVRRVDGLRARHRRPAGEGHAGAGGGRLRAFHVYLTDRERAPDPPFAWVVSSVCREYPGTLPSAALRELGYDGRDVSDWLLSDIAQLRAYDDIHHHWEAAKRGPGDQLQKPQGRA